MLMLFAHRAGSTVSLPTRICARILSTLASFIGPKMVQICFWAERTWQLVVMVACQQCPGLPSVCSLVPMGVAGAGRQGVASKEGRDVPWVLASQSAVFVSEPCGAGVQTLASLQSVRSAFLMGPKERAVYLRRPVPRGRQVVEQSGEEEAATVAGTNAAALRAWLRQVRHAVRPLWFGRHCL